VGRINNWWLNRTVTADWRLPISCVQGFRPVGGFLIGTAAAIEFVPNRFEAMVGGSAWRIDLDDITAVTLGRHRLRITLAAAESRTLFTNRPQAVRRHLAALLDRQPA
jgi:hypothetical protein